MITLAEVPVEIDRDEARDEAEAELSDRIYQEAQPSLIERAAQWLDDRVGEALGWLHGTLPGGLSGVLLLVLLGVVLFVVARLWVGKRARAHRIRRDGVLPPSPPSADEYRRAAERDAAQGRWNDAVQNRFRGLVRELEERGVFEERSGRTATEAGRTAGEWLPELAQEFRDVAILFNGVRYGRQEATPQDVSRMADVEAAVRRAPETVPA